MSVDYHTKAQKSRDKTDIRKVFLWLISHVCGLFGLDNVLKNMHRTFRQIIKLLFKSNITI